MPKRICCGISTAFFCCRLETVAFVIGWLGVVYRIIVTVLFGILLSMLTEYDPNIFKLAFSIVVGYCVVSFTVSVMLLVGVFKRIHCLLIPYLSLELFEILIVILIGLMRGFIMYFLGGEYQLIWFVPLTVGAVCFLTYSWIVIINLYEVYSSQTYNLEELNKNASIKLHTLA